MEEDFKPIIIGSSLKFINLTKEKKKYKESYFYLKF